jgi:hypothetical protein
MCYLGHNWKTIDGEDIWEYSLMLSVTERMDDFADYIVRKNRDMCLELAWKHSNMSRCSQGEIIRQNSDKTIDKTKNWSKKLCTACRGKGHSWKCAIWNGLPYLTPDGQSAPQGDHWEKPDWCKDCDGSGEA